MQTKELTISGKRCYLYEQKEAASFLIQPVDEHDLEILNQEIDAIRALTSHSFNLIAFEIEDWQRELTPWSAPAAFGKIPFGDGAKDTLSFLTDKLLPYLKESGFYSPEQMQLLLGGYSLAGLFALWSAYNTDLFCGIAAVSPSVWFPGWITYASSNTPNAPFIYLSLGDKEERTKNRMMAQVGDAIRKQYTLLEEQGHHTVLEWNPGNHFVDSAKRMAKGFAWLINH